MRKCWSYLELIREWAPRASHCQQRTSLLCHFFEVCIPVTFVGVSNFLPAFWTPRLKIKQRIIHNKNGLSYIWSIYESLVHENRGMAKVALLSSKWNKKSIFRWFQYYVPQDIYNGGRTFAFCVGRHLLTKWHFWSLLYGSICVFHISFAPPPYSVKSHCYNPAGEITNTPS